MELWQKKQSGRGSLYVVQCGWEACLPGHQYGPAVRDHYLIHFVEAGCGSFWTPEQEHPLEAGQGFIIYPGQVSTYRADVVHPWLYGWMGYNGYDAELLTKQVGLTRKRPVFTCADASALMAHIRSMHAGAAERLGEWNALGGLCQALALIAQGQTSDAGDAHRDYYDKALWYMEGNYQHGIGVEEVAAFVGLSRSQLFRVMRKVGNVSPKECLNAIRMRRAQMLAIHSNLGQEEIAFSVGLASASRLGVAFREAFGVTLGAYRKENK